MPTTKRTRRFVTIGPKIKMDQNAVARQKAQLDKAIAKLEALRTKREELRTLLSGDTSVYQGVMGVVDYGNKFTHNLSVKISGS